MKVLLKYSFLFFLVISLTSCLEYKEVKVINVTDVGIKNMSTKGIVVGVVMQIKNPNKYDISIVGSDLEILVEGNKIGVAKIKEKIKLKKKSNKLYHFTIKSSVEDITKGALPILLSLLTKSTIDLQIKGDIKAKAKGISKKFPVDFKEKVKL